MRFVVIMLVGAALTRYMTPETTDIHNRSRKLEDLAKGKTYRKDLEMGEREAAKARRKRQ